MWFNNKVSQSLLIIVISRVLAMFESSKVHLKRVDEGYFSHQKKAFSYSYRCLKAALMAFVHGIIPSMFQTSASDLVSSLAKSRK